MRILLWAPFGAGTHYWGPGTSAYRLYKTNNNKDIKVTLVHSSSLQSDFPDVYHDQVKIGNLGKKSVFSKIDYLIRSFLWIKKNHNKYDVFHGISAFYYTFLPALIFERYNKPAFIKITGQNGGFGSNSRISKFLGLSRYRLNNANRISGYLSISSDISKILEKDGIKSELIHYIPNGVDVNRFHPITKEEKTSKREVLGLENIFTIAYIGGLTENKRVIEIVKALDILLKQNFKLQLLIVGPDRSNGIVINNIIDFVKLNNLEKHITYIDHTDVPEKYFQVSDVFVLNSVYEGLSNSLIEAMSSGLPCIGTEASGTVDLIEDGVNGFITDGSSLQIAEKIIKLFSDDDFYFRTSVNARKKIELEYNAKNIINRHISLFKDMKFNKRVN